MKYYCNSFSSQIDAKRDFYWNTTWHSGTVTDRHSCKQCIVAKIPRK